LKTVSAAHSKDHILIAAQLLDAAKASDTGKVNDAQTRWYANADEIAAFLNGANHKNWPLDHIKTMMKMHLDLTLDDAVAQLQGNYAASIAAYEKVHQEILEMADMLSEGIIKQFPKQFQS